jgi:hypothetical protein
LRCLVLLTVLAACRAAGDPHADDATSVDSEAGAVDSDVVVWPFGLPPVDDACRSRFPSERPDDAVLARLIGTWTGFNGSGGDTRLTLGGDGRYAWVSDAGDVDLRDAAGRWSAFAADDRSALVLDDDVVPFRFDDEALYVENLEVGPGELRLTGGDGAASPPRIDPLTPPVAWCAATAEGWRPTHPWAERPKPDMLELRPDGSVAAAWSDGCRAEGGSWAVWQDDAALAPQLQWWLQAPCPEPHATSWVGDLDLSDGWIGSGDDTWWRASTSSTSAIVDDHDATFRLFGETPPEARVGTPFTLSLTLRHVHDDSPVVDRARLVQLLGEDDAADLAVADLGGVEISADDVLPNNEEVPVRLTWTPTAAQVGRDALQVRIDWRPYGREEFATFDVPLALWVDVADAR